MTYYNFSPHQGRPDRVPRQLSKKIDDFKWGHSDPPQVKGGQYREIVVIDWGLAIRRDRALTGSP